MDRFISMYRDCVVTYIYTFHRNLTLQSNPNFDHDTLPPSFPVSPTHSLSRSHLYISSPNCNLNSLLSPLCYLGWRLTLLIRVIG